MNRGGVGRVVGGFPDARLRGKFLVSPEDETFREKSDRRNRAPRMADEFLFN